MEINNILLLIKTILLILNIQLIDGNDGTVSVTVKPKQFNGFTKVIDGKELNVFLGIPYAKPPIGDLRFRKPVPFNYDKPIDATQWPNPCMQRIIPELLFSYLNKNFSEDCLFLNIWSPNDLSNEINVDNQQILKPVLFWIHGGGLLFGTSSMSFTSGDILATKGNVVVVSINYRLDYMGFLYSGTDDAPGNLGLWDQALALKWVNDNIENFGGDPQRITIFGNSAGGLSVSLHLVSPITRHLFKNAIVMSGSIHPFFIRDANLVRNNSLNVAKEFNCNLETISETVDCLRTVSAKKLISSKNITDFKLQVNPLYNEGFLPQNPFDMLKTGDYKKRVNVLFGSTDDEGSGLLSHFVDNVTYAEINPKNFSKSESKHEIKRIFASFGTNESIYEDVYKLYISQLPEHNYDLIRSSIGTAFGDYAITCPTTRFAKLLFNFNNSGNNVRLYQYMFSADRKPNSWHGSAHGSDIIYWFGNVPQNAVSVKMVDIISHFAHHGKPAPQQGIEWQSYYTIDDKLITPYYEITENPNLIEGNYGFGFKYQCEYFED